MTFSHEHQIYTEIIFSFSRSSQRFLNFIRRNAKDPLSIKTINEKEKEKKKNNETFLKFDFEFNEMSQIYIRHLIRTFSAFYPQYGNMQGICTAQRPRTKQQKKKMD